MAVNTIHRKAAATIGIGESGSLKAMRAETQRTTIVT
jgi:hypothetical protein